MDNFEIKSSDIVDASKDLPIFSLVTVMHDLATLINVRVSEIRSCRNEINDFKGIYRQKELATDQKYRELREKLRRLSNERDSLKTARSTISKMYDALLPEFSISGITTYRQLEDHYNEK